MCIQVFCVTWIKVLYSQPLKCHKAFSDFWAWMEDWIWESLSNLPGRHLQTWGLVLFCSCPLLNPKFRTAGRAVHPYHSLEAEHTQPSLKDYSQNDVLRVSLAISGLHLGFFSILVLFFIWWTQNWNNFSSSLGLSLTMRGEVGNDTTASTNLKDRSVLTSRWFSHINLLLLLLALDQP